MSGDMIDPLTVGHWEGDVFVFDEPFAVVDLDGNVNTLRQMDFGQFVSDDPTITRDDALHAVVNSVRRDGVHGEPL